MFFDHSPALHRVPANFLGATDTSGLLLDHSGTWGTWRGGRGRWLSPTRPGPRIWRISDSGKPVFRSAEWVSRLQTNFLSRVGAPSPRRTPRGGCGWRLVAGAGGVVRSARSANLSPEPSPKPTDISKMVRSPTEEISPAPGNVRLRKCTNFGGPTPMKRMSWVGTFTQTVNGTTYFRRSNQRDIVFY